MTRLAAIALILAATASPALAETIPVRVPYTMEQCMKMGSLTREGCVELVASMNKPIDGSTSPEQAEYDYNRSEAQYHYRADSVRIQNEYDHFMANVPRSAVRGR